MRLLSAVAGVAAIVLAASSAAASERDGRGGHGRQPPASCCHGGGNANINVNVNADASARASAYASAGSYLNARTYDVGSYRGGSSGGGVVYVGGGYGGDGGYAGGVGVYDDRVLEGPVCPSAPFGYVVTGFGRDRMQPSWCGYRAGYEEDRGGRYGYSERHDAYAGSRYEAREYLEENEAWYEEGGAYREDRDYRERHDDRDCDCRAERSPAPYPPAYLPEPPRYDPPARGQRRERPRPPRQRYSQEPGERG